MAEVQLQVFDVTARKVHQWTMVALVIAAFLTQGVAAVVLLAIAGAIMVGGRFAWPLDVPRQITWRVLEPARILPRVERAEDHETRRIARVIGGAIWLVAAGLVALGAVGPAFILAGLIAVMVALDASVDFCALCFVLAQLGIHRSTGS